MFKPLSDDCPLIQIIYFRSHWITVSNIPFKMGNDSLYIYDSLPSNNIGKHLSNLVCLFYKCSCEIDTLHFDAVNIQRQPNDYDCGVFAIAYATELAHGGALMSCEWDLANMRNHLLACLEQKEMKPFPCRRKRTIRLGRTIWHSTCLWRFIVHAECQMRRKGQ